MTNINTLRRMYRRANRGRKPIADCPQPEIEYKPHDGARADDERMYRERPSRRQDNEQI